MLLTFTNRKKTAFFLIFCFLFLTLLAAAQTVHAGPNPQGEMTPTVEADTEGTPAWLLTPFPTQAEGNSSARPGAMVATAALFLCGMVGMLVSGVGVAVLMVRLRTRRDR
ncbi:MAG: hypothetical protein IH586_19335 [Anaerolineaceae bacterium]|nr:hypothetical protein [Anaerolineaceae bacterium]